MTSCNHKFVEFHCIASKPPHKQFKTSIRFCVIESIAEAQEEQICVGGACCVYVNGGASMFVVSESYDDIMERIAVAEKEPV